MPQGARATIYRLLLSSAARSNWNSHVWTREGFAAKRRGMGEAPILHYRSYALEAERKTGKMITESGISQGVNPSEKTIKIRKLERRKTPDILTT
jgi:hypothetical protein